MENFLNRISSYNILNNFIPGAVFLYLSDKILGIDFLVENQILNLALIYFMGMVASRVGSIFIESIFEEIKFIQRTKHKDFVKAEKKDSKISALLETCNMYRTLVGMILLLFAEFVFVILCRCCPCVEKFKFVILCMILFLLFAFSYRKQTGYIKRRVKIKKKKGSDYKIQN